ncbi:MAG: glutamine synthetase family protein [Candidatus Aenigmatarchaeota archaeon]
MSFISLRFSDINGTLKEVIVSERKFKESKERGIWFDGSSILGLVRRFESDMRLKPDENSKFKLNDLEVYFCDVYSGNKPYEGDPRFILKKVLAEAEALGFKVFVAGELEFYLLKEGEKLDKGSYFDVSPKDKAHEVKLKIIEILTKAGIEWDTGHHEVGPGQNEIDIKYDNPVSSADKILFAKNVIKLVAESVGLKATFMPKPFFGLPGNGMHLHISLWNKEKNLFYDEKDVYKISHMAKSFIAGIFKHVKAITSITNPTVNSYKRLGEFEAPKYIYWGSKNRDALVRIPEVISQSSSRIEFRACDPSANPYLAFAVLIKAGLDGIKNNLELGEALEEDIYESGRYKDLESLPSTLGEALEELKKDELIRGLLGPSLGKFVELKEAEFEEYNKRKITDWEIEKYFDV